MKPLDDEQRRWHESETHRAYQGGKKAGYREAIDAFERGVSAQVYFQQGRDDGIAAGIRMAEEAARLAEAEEMLAQEQAE